MNRAFLLLPIPVLAACSGPDVHTRWLMFEKTCHPAFTDAQCAVLFSVKDSADKAQDAADSARIMSAASMGMAAGRSK